MSFGLYIHIPYCLQRCHYCDFATYEINTTLDPDSYFQLLKTEIKNRYEKIPYRNLASIYFGGGTPSLVKPQLIIDLIEHLANLGFQISEQTEVTIEINPGTTFEKNLPEYLNSPINRFSVGAQTFNDTLLKACGRKHDASDTSKTLALLKDNQLNFSLDILYGLPNQSLEGLTNDVRTALQFNPKHVSPYNLTLPQSHFLQKDRPTEDTQLAMFNVIKTELEDAGFLQYEISNFSLPEFESVHNNLYWSDEPYWGIGLSAHSYFPEHGLRFWNPKAMNSYKRTIDSENGQFSLNDLRKEVLFKDSYEYLKKHENMTDFCHIQLRKRVGMAKVALRKKFDSDLVEIILERLNSLTQEDLIEESETHWRFTDKGLNLSNLVYEKLCFTESELK